MRRESKAKDDLNIYLSIAQLAAMEAGNFALRYFTRVHVLREKLMSQDDVTWVDIESEKKIVKILKKNFPSHTVLTEERKLPKKRDEFIWLVDPLDGSISYFFGLPYWGISLALVYKGVPTVGVLYFPQTRDLYWATRAGGAFRNYERMNVSPQRRLSDGAIGIDYGYRREREVGVNEVTKRLIDTVKYAVTYACTVGALALVAEGKLVGYIHHMARRFDLAAGSLLITEAGGKVSNIRGQPVDWLDTQPFHFMATNGKIHHELLRVLS